MANAKARAKGKDTERSRHWSAIIATAGGIPLGSVPLLLVQPTTPELKCAQTVQERGMARDSARAKEEASTQNLLPKGKTKGKVSGAKEMAKETRAKDGTRVDSRKAKVKKFTESMIGRMAMPVLQAGRQSGASLQLKRQPRHRPHRRSSLG